MTWKQPIPTGLESIFGEDYCAMLLYKELIYRACNADTHFTDKRGKTTEVKRGQVVFGRNQWARYFDWDDMKVQRNLEKLEKTYKLVSKQSNTNFTLVELVNYEDLIKFEQASEQAVSKQRASSEQAVSTSKSIKSERVKETTPLPPDGGSEEASQKPLTRDGKELQISPEIQALWDYWETELAPITKHHGLNRNALSAMRKAYGEDLVKKMIRVVAKAHTDRYARKELKIAMPKQLQDNWGDLVLYAKAEYAKVANESYIPGKPKPKPHL